MRFCNRSALSPDRFENIEKNSRTVALVSDSEYEAVSGKWLRPCIESDLYPLVLGWWIGYVGTLHSG